MEEVIKNGNPEGKVNIVCTFGKDKSKKIEQQLKENNVKYLLLGGDENKRSKIIKAFLPDISSSSSSISILIIGYDMEGKKIENENTEIIHSMLWDDKPTIQWLESDNFIDTSGAREMLSKIIVTQDVDSLMFGSNTKEQRNQQHHHRRGGGGGRPVKNKHKRQHKVNKN